MTFFDPFYRALAYLGYNEPLHPLFTHFPIALVTTSLFLGLGAWLFRRRGYWITARHCLVLAWLFVFPSVVFGYMDWQYYYHGVWMDSIIAKIYLAGFLFVLLSIGLILEYRGRGESKFILVIYLLSFVTVGAAGYFGGTLVFEGVDSGSSAEVASLQVKEGEKIYGKNCRSCHPGGGNVITPQTPIIGSATLADFPRFLAWIRHPVLANGKRGAMPNYPPPQITNKEARELYRYLIHTFGPPKPPKPHP